MGDQRTYENILAIRAVTSDDAMTADWAKSPMSSGTDLQPDHQ